MVTAQKPRYRFQMVGKVVTHKWSGRDMHTRNGSIRRKRARLAVVAAVTALLLVIPQQAFASVSAVADVTAGTNGVVYDVAQIGGLTIVAGKFTAVKGQVRNNVAAIRADGKLDPTFNPNVNGVVYAVETDGTQVFLGGTFTTVGGTPRANLAAGDGVTGAVNTSWVVDVI